MESAPQAIRPRGSASVHAAVEAAPPSVHRCRSAYRGCGASHLVLPQLPGAGCKRPGVREVPCQRAGHPGDGVARAVEVRHTQDRRKCRFQLRRQPRGLRGRVRRVRPGSLHRGGPGRTPRLVRGRHPRTHGDFRLRAHRRIGNQVAGDRAPVAGLLRPCRWYRGCAYLSRSVGRADAHRANLDRHRGRAVADGRPTPDRTRPAPFGRPGADCHSHQPPGAEGEHRSAHCRHPSNTAIPRRYFAADRRAGGQSHGCHQVCHLRVGRSPGRQRRTSESAWRDDAGHPANAAGVWVYLPI